MTRTAVLVDIYSNYLKFSCHSQQRLSAGSYKNLTYIKNCDQYCFLCIEINILLKDLNSYLKAKPNIKN